VRHHTQPGFPGIYVGWRTEITRRGAQSRGDTECYGRRQILAKFNIFLLAAGRTGNLNMDSASKKVP